jgi:hypothetical protein
MLDFQSRRQIKLPPSNASTQALSSKVVGVEVISAWVTMRTC